MSSGGATKRTVSTHKFAEFCPSHASAPLAASALSKPSRAILCRESPVKVTRKHNHDRSDTAGLLWFLSHMWGGRGGERKGRTEPLLRLSWVWRGRSLPVERTVLLVSGETRGNGNTPPIHTCRRGLTAEILRGADFVVNFIYPAFLAKIICFCPMPCSPTSSPDSNLQICSLLWLSFFLPPRVFIKKTENPEAMAPEWSSMFHQKLSYMGTYLYLALNERPQEAAAWADLVQYLQRNLNKLTNEEIFPTWRGKKKKWNLSLIDLGTKTGWKPFAGQ